MNFFSRNLYHWFLCRAYLYFKVFRPVNIKIEGKVSLDLVSVIIFDKVGKVKIGDNCIVRKSHIDLQKADVQIANDSRFLNARIKIDNSTFIAGHSLVVQRAMVSMLDTNFTCGTHNMYTSKPYIKSGLFLNNSTISFGDHVNIWAHVYCRSATFTTGSNVFLNEGTQIRCTCSISIGSNVLVSYESIIFDTNTHSVDHIKRREEIAEGLPYNTGFNEAIDKDIKKMPVEIGDDVWVGMRAIILKGSKIGNRVIIGATTQVAGQTIEDDKKVVSSPPKIL